jgi:hypothetical protein
VFYAEILKFHSLAYKFAQRSSRSSLPANFNRHSELSGCFN